MSISGPEAYLTDEELLVLETRFTDVLQGTSCLVFWTGVSPYLAQKWAESHDLKTLTATMGPSYSEKGPGSLRSGKSAKAWSKIMKGASALFARYACRHRRVVVVTSPPPDIYSKRQNSNYRTIEEPILKGAGGGSSTLRIDLVHPTVPGAEDFQYEIWPLDKSTDWYMFVASLSARASICTVRSSGSPAQPAAGNGSEAQAPRNIKLIGCCQITEEVVGRKAGEQTSTGRPENNLLMLERSHTVEEDLKKLQARQKREAKRRKVELQEQRAREKKEARRLKVELEQRQAQEKKENKRRQAELRQSQAQGKKEARQRKAQREKEAKRQKAALEQLKAQEKAAAKQKAKLEQLTGKQRKEANKQKAKLEQVRAQQRKEANKQKARLAQQKAQQRKAANIEKARLDFLKAQERREANRRRLELEQLRT